MTRLTKGLFCISLFFLCSFLAIGYAKQTGRISVGGFVEAIPKPFEGVYIAHVEVHAQSGVSDHEFEWIKPTNLKSDLTVNAQNASITYAITVHNNTDMTYWYLGPDILRDIGQNALIGTSGGVFLSTKDNAASNSTLFDLSDWVPPQTYRTFYATYSFGANARGALDLLINFEFGLQMGSVQDGFLKILNDKVSAYGYYYLAGMFDEKYLESGSTVISNVGKEEEIFNNLFGTTLSVNVDGVDMPVTLLVERRNVDGSTSSGDSYSGGTPLGCEYTLYLTVDDLSSPGGKAVVHAVSYSCGADGVFYQIGELYEGESTIIDYDASNSQYEGAFKVDTWIATQNDYRVTDDITYKVGYEQGTNFDKMNTIEELMSVNDQEFYNKVNNSSGKLLKPVCNILYTYRHNNGRYDESINAQNQYKGGYEALKAAFDKIKPYCLIANGAQEVKIQNANSLSRAILIQWLEDIQTKYDYYMAVNPNG